MKALESTHTWDIRHSSIGHIVLQKYAKYNTKTGQYILEVAENIYNILELDTERGLKYFVYNKTTEYILLEGLLRTMQIYGQISKPTGNLTPLEKDIYEGIDAKICINGMYHNIDFTINEKKLGEHRKGIYYVYFPEDIVIRIRNAVLKRQNDTYKDFKEYIHTLFSDIPLDMWKFSYNKIEISLYDIIDKQKVKKQGGRKTIEYRQKSKRDQYLLNDTIGDDE